MPRGPPRNPAPPPAPATVRKSMTTDYSRRHLFAPPARHSPTTTLRPVTCNHIASQWPAAREVAEERAKVEGKSLAQQPRVMHSIAQTTRPEHTDKVKMVHLALFFRVCSLGLTSKQQHRHRHRNSHSSKRPAG